MQSNCSNDGGNVKQASYNANVDNCGIITRVQELLRLRRGSIFESQDGNCVVIQLHELLPLCLEGHHSGIEEDTPSIKMSGKPQPQDSEKKLFTANHRIDDKCCDLFV